MYDYKNMEGWEAVKAAFAQSELTSKEIAYRLGIRDSILRRFRSRADKYDPSLEMIPRLCRALGNTVLLDWLDVQAGFEEETIRPASSREEILTAVARASAVLGELNRLAADSEKGGVMPATAREIRAKSLEVIAECRVIMGKLSALASCDVVRGEPLASLGGQPSWWKMFKRYVNWRLEG